MIGEFTKSQEKLQLGLDIQHSSTYLHVPSQNTACKIAAWRCVPHTLGN